MNLLAYLAVAMLFFVGLGTAYGDTWTDAHLYAGTGTQHELTIQQTQPALTNAPENEPLFFTVRTSQPETVATTGLGQVVSQVKPDQTYGGYDEIAKADMQNQSATLSLVNSDGQNVYSLVIQPIQVEKQKDPQANNNWNMPDLPFYVYVLAGAGAVVVGLVAWRMREIGQIVKI